MSDSDFDAEEYLQPMIQNTTEKFDKDEGEPSEKLNVEEAKEAKESLEKDKESDNGEIDTEEQAYTITSSLFQELKNKFGVQLTKKIILKAAEKVGIPLKSSTERDSPNVVDNIDIEILKKKS